jgi:uncharacterized protein (TIGR02145 family)
MFTDMKKTFTFITIMLLFAVVSAQTVTLTFTGRDASNQNVPLSRVVVSNLTRGWQETLIWPDTVLVMTDHTGFEDLETFQETSLRLSQNNPNPFDGITFVNLILTEPGDVSLVITDITGRIVGANNYSPLQTGYHKIRITLSSEGTYFLTARQNGRTASVKMVNGGNGGGNAIAIMGTVGANNYSPLPQTKKVFKDLTDNLFLAGDQMEYVGFAAFNGTEVESGHVVQEQYGSQTIVLPFALPCSSTPTVCDIDGNIYNTVQIGEQCWMRENLRVTAGENGTVSGSMSDANPYYYINSDLDPAIYGYLYNWPAAMMACPEGWHLPSDTEWTQLTDYVSSQSYYVCGGENGYIAKVLASETGWNDYNGGMGLGPSECCPGDQSVNVNNVSGFGAFPVGFVGSGAEWVYVRIFAFFWSSTQSGTDEAWFRGLSYYNASVNRNYSDKASGYSVRCLRD